MENTIFLVTTKGVPLKVSGASDYYSGNQSSVDSDLALIFSTMSSGNNGKYINPYFDDDEHL